MTKAQANHSGGNDGSFSMWVRIGTVDGVKYLTKHFQVVIFSRDVNYEEFKNCNQV